MTAATPLISIVVPVYNGATTLETCLSSIAAAVRALPAQDRGRVEVVVCENHSTDASRAVAEAAVFDCPSRIVAPAEHLANRTTNWRFGLDAAGGTWLAMLHADDAFVPSAMTSWFEAIASPAGSRASLITGRHHTFTTTIEELTPPRPLFPTPSLIPGKALNRRVMALVCPFMPFVLMRRAAYDAVGGLDESLELTQDWDLWIRMCEKGEVLYWPAKIGAWRVHPTGDAYQRRNMREHMQMVRRLDGHTAPGIASLAKRSLQGRMRQALAQDRSPEALELQQAAQTLAGRASDRPGAWYRAAGVAASANLYALRLTGAVRVRSV